MSRSPGSTRSTDARNSRRSSCREHSRASRRRSSQEEIAERLRDLPEVFAVLAAVGESMIHPLPLDGRVVGLAFDCGMGASTNLLTTGLDKRGRAVAVLADLDLLDGAR